MTRRCWKGGLDISRWPLAGISTMKDLGHSNMGRDGWTILPTETINISHHAGGTVDDIKMVSKEFLGPSAHHWDVAIILKYFFDSRTVT